MPLRNQKEKKQNMPLTTRWAMRVLALRPWQLWWAVRIGVWLCGLPVRLRLYSLPGLLQRLTEVRAPQTHHQPMELETMVALVIQLCHLRPFRRSFFPRACLRQALALYYVLTRMGYPVTIHFGVAKTREALDGHSWVTIQGQPVAERLQPEHWQIVYSYPSASTCSPQEAREPRAGVEPSG
jgi:transglutaminase superfamily protein